MQYFYENNVRKIPGPSYVFDWIYTNPSKHPGMLDDAAIRADKNLLAVEIGRYILYSPKGTSSNPVSDNVASYAGTAWQKVYDNEKLKFSIVADKYTNPIQGMTGEQMQQVWDQVWGEDA